MKLNVVPFKPAPPVVETPKKTGYESPIGWWYVTTEGDCEGRTIRNLGHHYGHVAEIAFELANKCMYSLRFKADPNHMPPEEGCPRRQASSNKVWISLNIDSGTWDMSPDIRGEYMRKWLDTDDIIVKGKTEHATYYASCFIELKTN